MTRLSSSLRSLAFVYLTALIMVIGSERMFWFWSTDVPAQLEGAAFYALATASAIALMKRFHVSSWWSFMLVAPVVAFVVEGAITPVIYSGGPFVPIFPAWFSFWHGIFAFGGLVFLVRRLLVDRAMVALSAVATAFGAFWGIWSATLRLPENVNDPELIESSGGPLEVLDPAQFTWYAVVMTTVFIVGHALLGFVWPSAESSPGRTGRLSWGERITFGLVVAWVALWSSVVPWALPMFAGYCWLQLKGLRWHRSSQMDAGKPSLLDQLGGRVPFRVLLPLALMAPSAALVYALLWELDPSVAALQVVMYGTIAVQGLIGFVVGVKALLVARKARPSSSSASSTSRRVPLPSR